MRFTSKSFYSLEVYHRFTRDFEMFPNMDPDVVGKYWDMLDTTIAPKSSLHSPQERFWCCFSEKW
jgi:hypothetical protein